MKKWILCLMTAVAMQVVAADFTYKYLTVKTVDGTEVYLSSDGLTLTLADDQLVATNGDGSQTFALASLASMAFAETGGTTGIDASLAQSGGNARCEVYTLGGVYVGTYASASALQSQLKNGVYIVKQNNKSTKIIVK